MLSVSRKDRGAILPIGQSKQQVFWYQSGLFTTSRYYADTLPTWVQGFNARRLPFKAANTTWTLLLSDSAYKEPDNEVWENGGAGTVFPHRLPPDSVLAAAAVAGVPAMDSLTLLFARFVAGQIKCHLRVILACQLGLDGDINVCVPAVGPRGGHLRLFAHRDVDGRRAK